METQVDNNFLSQFIPTITSLVITGLISVVIGVLLERFRTRLSVIKYKIFNQPLATSLHSDYWGDVKVLHNNREIRHLSVLTFEIENTSNLDLEQVNVDISVDENSQILGHSAFYKESNSAILLEDKYYDHFNFILQRNQDDLRAKEENQEHQTPAQLTNEIKWIMTHKKFNLPVFNRKNSAVFNLMVENFKGEIPIGFLNIIHKSLKLEAYENKEKENKKTLIYTLVYGLIIYAICYFVLFRNFPTSVTPLILSLILGLFYTLVGLGIYRFYHYLRSQLK